MRKYIFLIIIFLLVIIIGCSPIMLELDDPISKTLKIIETMSQIAVIYGAVFAIYQYSNQKKRDRISKAAEFANLFRTELLSLLSMIILKFYDNESGVTEYFEKIENQLRNAKAYNKNELERIFNDTTITAKMEEIFEEKIKIEGKPSTTVKSLI